MKSPEKRFRETFGRSSYFEYFEIQKKNKIFKIFLYWPIFLNILKILNSKKSNFGGVHYILNILKFKKIKKIKIFKIFLYWLICLNILFFFEIHLAPVPWPQCHLAPVYIFEFSEFKKIKKIKQK